MYLGKLWLKTFSIGCVILTIILSAFTYQTYKIAREQMNMVFPELVRLVAEDNCLDNTISFSGKTTYQAYVDKLEQINLRNPLIQFRSDAISVPYTSRASAPQRGTTIPVKLTGYWTVTIPVFGGIPVNYRMTRELNVIGIREYRDR